MRPARSVLEPLHPPIVSKPSLRAHIQLARFDHWLKNVFVLPGIVAAVALDPGRFRPVQLGHLAIGMLAVGLVASSNYVLNEILDAPWDRLHPLKRDRPAAAGRISLRWAWFQWIALFAGGVALGSMLSSAFVWCLAALWIMGVAYNAPPMRLKDVPFVDVLAESVNTPIRFLAGWYMTGKDLIPVTSLLVSYWMAGAYLMALKRFAELRDLRSSAIRTHYRKCFSYYTEQNLLVSVLFYSSMAMLFFGAFIGRYRLEMVLSFPGMAIVMAVYMALAFKPDSAVQRPEGLIREPWLMGAVLACAAVMTALLFIDIAWLHELFTPTSTPGSWRK